MKLTEFAAKIDLPSTRSPNFQEWYEARRKISNLAWDLHSANAYWHYRASNPGNNLPLIEKTGLYDEGRLTLRDAEVLLKLFNECPIKPFSTDDFAPGYNFDPTGSLGAVNTYRTMSPAFKDKLSEVLAEIVPVIEQVCGHYFRIVTSHIWSLNPGPRKYGWHFDGWPIALKKLFIFPAGADESHGTTAFRLKTGIEKFVQGPPGTWMIFENSIVEHKGVESLTESRPSIAIYIAPAFRTDLTLFDAGTNSGYPWFPIERESQGIAYANTDHFSPANLNHRMLVTVLEAAGMSDLVMSDGVIQEKSSVKSDSSIPAAVQSVTSLSLKQRIQSKIRHLLLQ